MKKFNFDKFIEKMWIDIDNTIKVHPYLRKGQCVYNYSWDHFRSLNLKVFDNRDVDPYYVNAKIDMFLKELRKELQSLDLLT